jgi:hypothetical protein
MAAKANTEELFDLQSALRETAPTFVYVISAGPALQKIGVARNARARMAVLQTAAQSKLVLVNAEPVHPKDAFAVETRAHRLLASRRVSGEWFVVGEEAAKLAVEAGLRTLMRGEPLKQDVAPPTRRVTPDGLVSLWRRGAISQEQCKVALRYRAVLAALMERKANGLHLYAPIRRVGSLKVSDEGLAITCRSWEQAIGMEFGATGVMLLREVVGAGAALRSHFASGQRRSSRAWMPLRPILDRLEQLQSAETERLAAA